MPRYKFGRSAPPHQRDPVPWYQPDVLWTAAQEVLSSLDQLRNHDQRETYTLPLTVIDRSDATGDFWFDFIADTGDGGNASYAVASTALAPEQHGDDGEVLPRGELLLFGGDLAYPSASPDAYRYRFIEMFEAVRNDTAPTLVRGRPLTVAALAQNHDWMDSASTFNRYFMRREDSAPFLGAEIPQRQSYFCTRLPQGWWALGLDFALSHDIDRDQYEQFAKLAGEGIVDGQGHRHRIGPDDQVLLIYPEPYWTRPLGDGADPTVPKRYQRLEGLLGDRVRLRLAGDLHHYLRWDSPQHGHLLICGTGGAFTHPTHTKSTTRNIRLDSWRHDDTIPPEPAAHPPARVVGLSDDKTGSFERIERTAFPSRTESRWRAAGNIVALFKLNRNGWGGNWLFAAMLGIVYWFIAYLNSTPFIDSFWLDGFGPMRNFTDHYGTALGLWFKAMVFSPLGLLTNALLMFGCAAMGRETVDEYSPSYGRTRRWWITWGTGLVHALFHLLAIFSLLFLLQRGVACLPGIGQSTSTLGVLVRAVLVGSGMLLGGALVGALSFGLYLAGMSCAGYLTNNGYSALGIQDFKGFLRLRIGADGSLHVHFLALDKVPKRWKTSDKQTGPIWLPDDPAVPLKPRVHDRFTIAPRSGPVQARS